MVHRSRASGARIPQVGWAASCIPTVTSSLGNGGGTSHMAMVWYVTSAAPASHIMKDSLSMTCSMDMELSGGQGGHGLGASSALGRRMVLAFIFGQMGPGTLVSGGRTQFTVLGNTSAKTGANISASGQIPSCMG